MSNRFHPEDYIPAFPTCRGPDILYQREVPRPLVPPSGSPTVDFNPETGELCINFKDRLADFELLRGGLREYGRDKIKQVTLWICQDASSEAVIRLSQLGFERVTVNDPKNALFCWRKALKPKKAKEEHDRSRESAKGNSNQEAPPRQAALDDDDAAS